MPVRRAMEATVGYKSLVAAGFSLLVGCSTSPHKARRQAADIAGERLSETIRWHQGTAEDAAADGLVRRLLSSPLTADAAVRIALLRNPQMQATLENLGIAQADLVQAGLLGNLHFGGGPRFPTSGTPVGWEGDLAFNFFEAFLIPARKKLARAELQAAILDVAHETIALDAEVREAFFEVVAAQQLADLQQRVTETAEIAAELAERQDEAGTLNELEQAEIQSEYQISKLELARARLALVGHREHLNRLLGLWGDEVKWRTVPKLPALPEREPDLGHLERIAVGQRLDLAAMRAEVEAMTTAVRLARGSRFVDVELGALGEADPGDGPTFGPFLELEIPIFDWGQAQIPRLEAELRRAQHRLRGLAIDARSDVRFGRAEMVAKRQAAEYVRDFIVPQRVKMVDLAQTRYDAMLLGVYDLLETKQSEYEARRDLVAELRNYWIARTRLERAIGGRLGPSVKRWHEAAATDHTAAGPTESLKNGARRGRARK